MGQEVCVRLHCLAVGLLVPGAEYLVSTNPFTSVFCKEARPEWSLASLSCLVGTEHRSRASIVRTNPLIPLVMKRFSRVVFAIHY